MPREDAVDPGPPGSLGCQVLAGRSGKLMGAVLSTLLTSGSERVRRCRGGAPDICPSTPSPPARRTVHRDQTCTTHCRLCHSAHFHHQYIRCLAALLSGRLPGVCV